MQDMTSPLTSGAEADFLDNNHRIINYLRLSLTDRCNLRCIYCMPEEGFRFVPHTEVLTYEEMLRVVSLCVLQGIRKVRLTGGEPEMRSVIRSLGLIRPVHSEPLDDPAESDAPEGAGHRSNDQPRKR